MIPASPFNQQIRQALLLLLLLLISLLVIKELYVFLPGLLGALTLYILGRDSYFRLVYHRKWRKGWTAGLYILTYFVLSGSIAYFTFSMLGRQLHEFVGNPATIFDRAENIINSIQQKAGISLISEDAFLDLKKKITVILPRLVNNTINLLANQAILLFVLYYMFVHGKEIESFLLRTIPLKRTNINLLAHDTKRMIKASALGIPLISVIQGASATIGYIIFGLDNYVLWGFLTGIFAFFPVVGTMIIWVPLVIFMYTENNSWNAVGLLFYSLIITGNIDYISRITILKKLGNVHPIVTVLGIIIGLGLFGFIGFIFGPLLINYIAVIFKIYINEFIEIDLNK